MVIINLNFFCVETELCVWICLVETERGGVISLLSSDNIPDNLSEIGVEYVEVSFSVLFSFSGLNIVLLNNIIFVFKHMNVWTCKVWCSWH